MFETASKILCLNEKCLFFLEISFLNLVILYTSHVKNISFFFFMLRGLSTETMESDM